VKTSKPSTQDLPLSISQLKSEWLQLADVDRALAVAAIRRSGTSIRQIARELGQRESGLRRILKTLDASPNDQDLARNKQISTSELIRRGQTANLQHAEQEGQVLQSKLARSTRKGSDLICNWICEQQISGPDGEFIIEEVRREFATRDQLDKLPEYPKRAAPPLPELIRRCKPERPKDDNSSSNAWYHEWLCSRSPVTYPAYWESK
jgi:transposase-like protein